MDSLVVPRNRFTTVSSSEEFIIVSILASASLLCIEFTIRSASASPLSMLFVVVCFIDLVDVVVNVFLIES